MKKLMIAAAIVCAAAMAQASAWTWSASGMPAASRNMYDLSSSSTLLSTTPSAILYLFDAGVTSQDSILTALRDSSSGKSSLSDFTSVATSTLDTNSRLTTKDIAAYGGTSGTYNFFMAVQDAAGNIFLSASVPATAQESSPAGISFSGLATATAKDWTSDATFKFDTADGGKGAGWYAVPEPTSGLLLLLGVAGLALRRRRA